MTAEDARALTVAAELARDWAVVGKHLAIARSVDPAAGRADAALVALSLDHAYQAFETLLVRIERVLGQPPRAGSEWHRSILADASMPIAGLRGPVSSAERDWDELRRFRHFLRHAYTVELDAERLRANVVRLERAHALDDPHVAALIAVLAPVDQGS